MKNKIDYLEITCKLICINFKAMLSIETRTILEKEPGTRTDNEVHMVSRKQNAGLTRAIDKQKWNLLKDTSLKKSTPYLHFKTHTNEARWGQEEKWKAQFSRFCREIGLETTWNLKSILSLVSHPTGSSGAEKLQVSGWIPGSHEEKNSGEGLVRKVRSIFY